MKKRFILLAISTILAAGANSAYAQFDFKKAIGGVQKAFQAFTLSDKQMAQYVKETIRQMDKDNNVLPADSPYTIRLNRLVEGITDADGIPLNFKVYKVADVNAFACPDGSVRVFSALMDIMDDNELMGIIGHEIGHVVKRHSKNALKNQLMTGALKDAIASTSGKAAALTESQISKLGEALINAKYSQKQENEADDCGYDFLVANKRNPWGMVMSFEKLQALEGTSTKSTTVQKMFSSHPETIKRIERMTKRCNADGYKRPQSPADTSTKSKTSKSKKSSSKKK